MKLQASSKKEIKRIAIGTTVCSVIMVAVLYLLSQVGVGTFDIKRILLSAVIGSVIAILNFVILCLTVQNCVGIEDQKQMKAKFQVSYNFRMLFQAAWVVVALLVPGIHVVAGAVPLLFPHAVIMFLNARGKLMPPDKHEPAPQEDDPPQTPES